MNDGRSYNSSPKPKPFGSVNNIDEYMKKRILDALIFSVLYAGYDLAKFNSLRDKFSSKKSGEKSYSDYDNLIPNLKAAIRALHNAKNKDFISFITRNSVEFVDIATNSFDDNDRLVIKTFLSDKDVLQKILVSDAVSDNPILLTSFEGCDSEKLNLLKFIQQKIIEDYKAEETVLKK